MKLRTRLLSTAVAIGVGAVALPAAADDFFFDATAVAAFGAPTYGKVSLSQAGTGVLFNVTLDPEFNFVTTGNHFVFSFSGTGVALGDIGTITDAGPQTFSVSTHQISQNCGVLCASFRWTLCCEIIVLFSLGGVQPSGRHPAGATR